MKTNTLIKSKYYTIQNGYLIEQQSANEAQYVYSKIKDASLIEILPDNKTLLFNRIFDNPVSCDNVNHALYLASRLREKGLK